MIPVFSFCGDVKSQVYFGVWKADHGIRVFWVKLSDFQSGGIFNLSLRDS
jgi:hypothetical protein